MKEDDMAKKKKKVDLQSMPLTSEGAREEEGMKKRNLSFLAVCFQWKIVNDICKTKGSDKVKRSRCAN